MTAEPIGDVLRLIRPADAGEPSQRTEALQLIAATLDVARHVGHAPALAWLWLLSAASPETGLANITAAQLAADTSPPGKKQRTARSAQRDLRALMVAGIAGGDGPMDGRNGGWLLRPMEPAAVEAKYAGAPHAVRGDAQTLLPLTDSNATSNRDSVSRLPLGGKGGASSNVSLSSFQSAALRSSDVRRLTSDDQIFLGKEAETMADSSLDVQWFAAVQRVKQTVRSARRLEPKNDNDLKLLLKCSYLVETGTWPEFLFVDAVEGASKSQNVPSEFSIPRWMKSTPTRDQALDTT